MKKINKVLTFRASSLGDSMMGKYFLENVHAYAPEARCYLLVGSRAKMIRELFEMYPWITVVEASRRSFKSIAQAYQTLSGTDLALTQEAENPFSTVSKFFARAVTRRGGLMGFEDGWWGNKLLYDTILPYDGEEKSLGMIEEERKALKAAGIPIPIKDFSLLYREVPEVVPRFKLTAGRYIVVHFFAGAEGKSMSKEKQMAIVRHLREVLPQDIAIVLTGAKANKARSLETAAGLANVLVASGETSIPELVTLIAHAAVIIATNTGAGHIAGHLKKPLVMLAHKKGIPGWWSEAMYHGEPKVLCNESEDDRAPRKSVYPPTLETITPEQVTEAVKSFGVI